MSHSIEEQRLFVKKDDFRLFLGILARTQREYCLKIFAYCLLNSHYHVLLQTPLANLGQAMQYLNGMYAIACNSRRGRLGHLTQRRYNYRVIEDQDYFQIVACYIASNPVNAGLVARPEDWVFSSYRATIGLSKPPRFLDIDGLLDFFSPFRGLRADAYSAFLKETDTIEREFDEHLVLSRPTLSYIFGSMEREMAICEAVRRWEYRHAEVADFLGLRRSAITKILQKFTKSA
jgi:REP element-mobilizing transposase RayT